MLNIVQNSDVVNDLDPANRAIVKYEHHYSILIIKEVFINKEKFSFVHYMDENMCDEIRSLNISNAYSKTPFHQTRSKITVISLL